MPQIARPIADLRNALWKPEPLYAQLNELPPDTSTFVSSREDPSPDVFEVKLTPLAWPGAAGGAPASSSSSSSPFGLAWPPAGGAQSLAAILRKVGAGSVLVTIALMEGDQVIAVQEVTPGDSFQGVAIALTAEQTARITNYANLRVRVIAGTIVSACCPGVILPHALKATLSDCSCAAPNQGVAFCYNGRKVLLVWDPNVVGWKCSYTMCGFTGSFWVRCLGTTPLHYYFSALNAIGGGSNTYPSYATCDPFELRYSPFVAFSHPDCAGAVTMTPAKAGD